jgi:hypothetical protein
MRRFFSGPRLRESASLALFAAGRALRHQLWELLATKKWYLAARWLQASVLAVSLAAFVRPAAAADAHTHTYEVITADVPFQFYIGERSFAPGQYQFIMVGNGLLAVRDTGKHFVASLVTRSATAGGPAANKLVFTHRKKRPYLTQLFVENR